MSRRRGGRSVAIDIATARFLCCEVIGDVCSCLLFVLVSEFVRRLGVEPVVGSTGPRPWKAARCRRVAVRVLRPDFDE
jgi:hypothetical protein